MNRISVAIVTKNAEKNIEDCLEAIKWADEILILDRMSVDRTVDICKKYKNLKVEMGKDDVPIGSLRNYLFEKITGEWMLLLDPDEIVTPRLAEEIQEAVTDTSKVGYSLPRRNMFLGQWIKECGWWPDKVIRLTKKGGIEYPDNLHSTITTDEKNQIGHLENPLIHNSYLSLEQYFQKFNFYTNELSKEEYKKGVRISKFNFFTCFIIKPVYWFLRKYFFQRGWRIGFRGFFISFSSALVIFTTYAKLWEIQNNS